jgi:hypothetical protein
MARHLNVPEYWSDISQRLERHINNKRNKIVENCLTHSFAFYSFVEESFITRTTKNQALLQHTSIMLVHMQDVLRGLISAQAELSPVATAALLRIALEVRCNQLFIIKSSDPAMYADRYSRYAGVEKLLHDQHEPLDAHRLLSADEAGRIRSTCPEWLNSSGKVEVMHWTADKKYNSLKKLADAVGLSDEYRKLYSFGSKFIHGSKLLENLYAPNGSLGALSNPELCSQLSVLAAAQSVHMIREATNFFGVPLPEDDYAAWLHNWLQCYESLNRTEQQPRRG